MTPELKVSCEVVFQEHKTHPITWNKDAFRGRMSIGLCEMAKETLVQKKIIYFPKAPKKTITLLNPDVATATSYEEAVAMIQDNTGSFKKVITESPVYTETPVPEFISYSPQLANHASSQAAVWVAEKWYLRPLFVYFVWPVTALVVSVAIAYLMSEVVAMGYR